MNAFTFEDFQNLSKQQVEVATAFANTVSKGLQDIAAETADYSKQSMAASAEAMERLLGAKSVESAVQIQSEFAKAAFEGFVAKSTKINEIIAKVAADAMKPAQQAFSVGAAKH
jgi:phasin family protein